MKTLAEQMAIYGAYHRNPWNRLTHFIGVPVIVFSLLIPLSWLRVGLGPLEITAAMLVVGAMLLYYLLLDWRVGLLMVLMLGGILYLSDWVARSFAESTVWVICGFAFIGGWALQLLGHVFEGRRPALVDNLWQIFVAPIFLAAEVYFMFGARSELRNDVESRIQSASN